jgi:hypothetical protein
MSNCQVPLNVDGGGAPLGHRWATAHPPNFFKIFFYVDNYKYIIDFKYKFQTDLPDSLHFHTMFCDFFTLRTKILMDLIKWLIFYSFKKRMIR